MGISRALWGLSGNAESVWIETAALAGVAGGSKCGILPVLWLSAASTARLTPLGGCVCGYDGAVSSPCSWLFLGGAWITEQNPACGPQGKASLFVFDSYMHSMAPEV